MKTFNACAFALCALLLVSFTSAQNPKDAQITRYENDNIGVDGYNFAVETSDGKSASEVGQVENLGTDDEAISVKGSYSYIGPDGITYTVNYIADKNGFQPYGEHIPQV